MADSNNGFMSCELKVDTSSSGWHKTMIKVFKGIKGISYTIDARAGIAYVSGTVDPNTLLQLLAKAGKHAELLRVDSGYHLQFYREKAKAAVNYRHGSGPSGYGGVYYDDQINRSSYGTTDHHYHHQYYTTNYYKRPTQPQPPLPPKAPDTKCSIM